MDFLRVADLGVDGLKNALDLSIMAKQDPARFATPLHGTEVGLFYTDHARSRIFDQAENLMHSFRGTLLHLTQ